ncbi:MAG: cobyrinate a,c-diamide synthase [Synergistetes bacterium]|nr:cobyrinate a,c-diamide synthase [Synergistota bacterium]
MKTIKACVIAGLKTYTGKTTFTMGLMKLLKEKGKVSSFKIGPDYIDPICHYLAIGLYSRTLDSFFLPPEMLRLHFARHSWDSDFAVVEGVMGVLDGLPDGRASTDHVSSILNLPVVLLVESMQTVYTLAAMVEGVLRRIRSKVLSIVFINVKNKRMFDFQRRAIERFTGVKVAGFIPFDERLRVPSRHLGLDTDFERYSEVAEIMAELIKSNVNLEEILGEVSVRKPDHEKLFKNDLSINLNKRVVAVSKDRAFRFIYPDNITWFEDNGFKVVYFSPLYDETPPDAGIYYLAGGYPELYAETLSRNKSMLKAMREIAEDSSLYLLAECGGFMYLTRSVEGHEMVGFINGETLSTTGGLKRFGYEYVKVLKDTFFSRGTILKGHEFHYSVTNLREEEDALLIRKASTGEKFVSGIARENTLASYTHLYLPSISFEDKDG